MQRPLIAYFEHVLEVTAEHVVIPFTGPRKVVSHIGLHVQVLEPLLEHLLHAPDTIHLLALGLKPHCSHVLYGIGDKSHITLPLLCQSLTNLRLLSQ